MMEASDPIQLCLHVIPWKIAPTERKLWLLQEIVFSLPTTWQVDNATPPFPGTARTHLGATKTRMVVQTSRLSQAPYPT